MNFMPRLLYSGKESLYALSRKLGGLQNQSGHFGKEKYLLLLPGFKPRSVQPIA